MKPKSIPFPLEEMVVNCEKKTKKALNLTIKTKSLSFNDFIQDQNFKTKFSLNTQSSSNFIEIKSYIFVINSMFDNENFSKRKLLYLHSPLPF